METITTHLREVHYQLAVTCNICKAFVSMSAQVFLEHCSGCKVKLHKKISKVKEQEKPPKVSSSGTDKSCRVARCLRPFIPFHL